MFKSFRRFDTPYTHFESIGESLPTSVAKDVASLTQETELYKVTGSRSDYKSRTFLNNTSYSSFSTSIQTFLDTLTSESFYEEVVTTFGVDLRGSDIRAEVIGDTDGFYQNAHTDSSDKRISWLTYLGGTEQGDNLGTELYDTDLNLVKTSQWGFNNGLIFLPANNTWHGLSKGAKIVGIRKLLIINFVDDWKDEFQLYKH